MFTRKMNTRCVIIKNNSNVDIFYKLKFIKSTIAT